MPVTRPKRAYSTEFTPRTERRVTITVDAVPPTLKAEFAAKVKRDGLAMRSLVLRWVRNYTAGRRPDEDDTRGTRR